MMPRCLGATPIPAYTVSYANMMLAFGIQERKAGTQSRSSPEVSPHGKPISTGRNAVIPLFSSVGTRFSRVRTEVAPFCFVEISEMRKRRLATAN